MNEVRYYGEIQTGAWATLRLVGRAREREKIETAIRASDKVYVVYVYGQGGIGKTFLLRHLLRGWRESPPEGLHLQVAAELIDLYHTRHHTVQGLMRAIQEALTTEAFTAEEEQPFRRYVEERKKLEGYRIRPPEDPREIERQRERVSEAFFEGLERLARHRRIVLALDTAERLFYREDPAAKRLGLEEHPEVLHWLLNDFLPKLRNAVVLLAGRPGPGTLEEELKRRAQASRFEVLSIGLKGLTEEEALNYFKAVAEAAEKMDEEEGGLVREYLGRLRDEEKRAVFHCLRGDDGTVRPILLSLAVDHLVVAGHPMEELTVPLGVAQALSSEKREEIRGKLIRRVIESLHERRRPADQIVLALGRLRKGADVDLLSRVTGLSEEEIEAVLDRVRSLSFVKVRPADDRLFLHDEMYDFLQPLLLERAPFTEQKRWFEEVEKYYQERVEMWRRRVADLYRPVGREVLPPDEVAEGIERALIHVREAMVEDLYYRLCWDPARGFQTYFRYAEEALAAQDESLDLLLRAELLGFLAEQDPEGEEIDGLRRADVTADAAVRWIKRLINREQIPEALYVAKRLAEGGEAADLIEGGGDLARAERDAWWALARVYSGEFTEEVEDQLKNAIKGLEEIGKEGQQTFRWAGILARAYNNRGYLRRVLGKYYGAVDDYEIAVSLWRAAKIESELANTLNNLAFAKAEVGWFSTAWRVGQEALRRREEMGPRVPVGLSLNALALVAIRDDKPVTARRYARRALRLFRSLAHRRREGLARVALSEALRRWADRSDKPGWVLDALKACYGKEISDEGTMEGWKVWDEVAQLLEEEKSIEKPHDLLTSPDRQVEALIELGCVYRDLLRFLMRELRATIDDRGSGLARRAAETATDYGLLRYLGPEEAVEVAERARRALLEGLKEKLKGLGEQTLLDAAARAEKAGLLYRRMEALVNLAWLYYYLDQQDRGGEVRRILEEAEQTLPSEYEVGGELWRVVKDEKRKAEERDKVILPFLIQKGKAELLRGQIAFNKYQYADGGDKALEEAIRHYFLSLAYDSAFFDHSFRDMRRGMDRIYERLCQLGPRRLRQVWGWTIDLEDNYDLKTQVIDEETGERGSRFRRFLRDSFGPPEHLYEISED